MVAENTKKTPQESASVQPATKRATPKKPTTTTPVKQPKPAPPPTKKPSKRKLPQKVRKGKPTFQLIDEDADLERAIKLSLDPAFLPQGRAPVGGVTIRDPVSETTSKLHEVVGKGKAVVTEEQVAHSLIDLSKKKRTTDQFILARRDQTPPDSTTGPSSQPDDDTSEKVIHESSSTSDSERTKSETEAAAPKGDKDQDEVDMSTVTSGVSIPVSDPEKAHEALAGPDPEPMKEDQTGSDSGKLHVSLAGPNPEHMDEEFLATAYPKVHENLKLITDERVIDDKPESHSGSMSSMKNLDDTFNFGDQFLHDKPTEDEQEKSKVREESDSTIPDSSHQTVTSTPPVIVPFTEVSSSKPSLLVTPPPINTEATTITTSLPEITPFIALQLRVARLEQEMSEVKKTDHSADVLASIRSQVPTAIADEDAMDKEVADKVKDHKRKHDSDDDETWFKTRVVNKEKENLILLLLGQLKPPLKDDDKSLTQERYQNIMGQIAYATTFKVPEENKLQRKTYDMGSFIKWFCRRTGKKKLYKANLEGPAFNLVKAFQQCDKERKIALSISKLKAARYLDFGLEELVPSLWVESEREYDISAVYDITHWWFRRKEFYINKHSESSDREAVRSQMRILSVISVKAVRLNELHKFSDGTLTRVMEKLDQMVKDFHLYEYNKGMETRKWSEDDKRRSKDFITAIEKRLHDQKGIYRI
ncbi:hypothetical protein Tco_1042879 [Tanacetum coccineum]|uniref:Uncharacterized protein n=1 Tax=Tanacetum coccineum TaxID=301880 RepID=A0ABQ5GLF0_9ASTR